MSTAPAKQATNGRAPSGIDGEQSPLSDAQSKVLVNAVERASRVGLVMRTLLFGVAIAAASLAIVYTWARGDEMVDAILSRDRSTDLLWEQVASLTLPVLLFVLLGAVCVAGAYVLQSRALDERERALDAISRIRREAEAGVSRARTLARLTEDDLTHIRREFTMQVAFGRMSYWLSLSLVAMSAIYSIAAGDLDAYSAAFSAGGVLSYLLGVMFKVPWRVAIQPRRTLPAPPDRDRLRARARHHRGRRVPPDRAGAPAAGRRAAGPAGLPAHAREIRAATGTAIARIEEHCKREQATEQKP